MYISVDETKRRSRFLDRQRFADARAMFDVSFTPAAANLFDKNICRMYLCIFEFLA